MLSNFAILSTINCERLVSCSRKFGTVCVIDGERDCLPAEPVTDVICIAVEQSNADTSIEQHVYILEEVGVDEVARCLESIINIVVAFGIVEVDCGLLASG